MKRLLHFFLVVMFTALGGSSLRADVDNTTPVSVTITTPVNNAVYDYGDVSVNGILITTQLHGGFLSTDKANTLINGVTFTPQASPVGGAVSWQFYPPTPGIYYLQGIFSTYTSEVNRIIVKGVQITTPASDVMVPLGSSFVVKSEAYSADNIVASVVYRLIPYDSSSGTYSPDNAETTITTTNYPYSCFFTPKSITNGTPYQLMATAICSDGSTLSSNTINVRVVTPVGNMPSVIIKTPTAGASLSASSSTSIAADATDSDGYIERVDFYVNGVLQKSVTSIPYTVSWTPVVAGSYVITVLATDDKMNVAMDNRSVTAVDVFPTGKIVSPDAGISIIQGATQSVTVKAAGPSGGLTSLSRIDLYVDGVATGDYLPQNPDNVTPAPKLSEPLTFSWVASVSLGNHTISALVTDSSGYSIQTDPITVTVVANNPPTVSITNPTADSSFQIGQTLTLTADAKDVDGTIASVSFYVNSNLVGKTTTYPYSMTYTPSTAGTYTLVAKATDDLAATTSSSAVTFTVQKPVGNAPTVSLSFNDPNVEPTSADSSTSIPVFSGSKILVKALAVDTDGYISKVEFYMNGTLVQTNYAAPYYMSRTITGLGSVNILAVVTDNDGNRVQSSPLPLYLYSMRNPDAFSVKLASPTASSSFKAGESISFVASHNLTSSSINAATGGVSTITPKMDIYLNGDFLLTMAQATQISGSISLTGTYDVRASVRASSFTTTSDPASITIVGNSLPSVSITSPSTGAGVVAGVATTIKADASDSDGSIASVQFFANGVSVGTSTKSPFTASWTPSSAGIYKLTAMATDNSGGVTVSSTVAVQAVSSSSLGTLTNVYFSPSASWSSTPNSNLLGCYAIASYNGVGYFFGVESNGTTARLLTDISVSNSGAMSLTNTNVLSKLSCTLSSSSAAGTYQVGTALSAFACTSASSSSTIPAGFYKGSISSNSSSTVIALVNGDGRIALYVSDGSRKELALGTLLSDNSFSLTTTGGTTLKGSLTASTAVITATATNGITGSITASKPAATISGLSDGSLRNISARGQVGSGEKVMIAGFVIGGDTSKQVLVRAVGPGLSALGVSNTTSNPRLTMYSGSTAVAYNSGWSANPLVSSASTKVGAFSLSSSSSDSALVLTLAQGAYTAMVDADSGTDGTSLVEVYDVNSVAAYSARKVVNISARAVVGTTDEQKLIAGFVIDGSLTKKVLIRGVGPTLSTLGVSGYLPNPKITLYKQQSDGTYSTSGGGESADWQSAGNSDAIAAAATKVGAFSLSSTDTKSAALLLDLAPGIYTVIVSSEDSQTGVALVEVYDVQ